MTRVRIRAIDIYHPEHSKGNEEYIRHFHDTKGEDISAFLTDVLGRNTRYLINNNSGANKQSENTLTMGVEAAKRTLNKAGVKAKDLDMIYFVSQTPEYLFPTNAVMLHREIEAGSKTGTLDMNSNCSGMTAGFEQACRYLNANPNMNTLLLVGSDYASLVMDPNDSITYPNFGDAACAVLLEKTEENGFFDSTYYTESSNYDRVTFPANGLSNALRGEGSIKKYVQWLPFDGAVSINNAEVLIRDLLQRNSLKPNDVKAYCLSQFAISNINLLRERFDIIQDKMIYIGDRYGYTGTTSPLIALYHAIEDGKVQRGDTVLLWTVGVGYQLIAVLLTY